ncbi:MAG: metal-dependent hydrolase [Thermodesulfobacteriota bacterium]
MAPVRIRWMGHSGFTIRDGKTVLIDPWFEGNPKAPGDAVSTGTADLILLTHDHFDHVGDAVALAKRTGALIVAIHELCGDMKAKGVPPEQLLHGGIGMNVGGTVEALGFSITMTEAHHSSTLGSPVGYILRTPSGKTVYHSGDTAIFASMTLLGELYPIDVAMLPIGSVFTMDYRQAAKACALLKAKAVVPMHYGTFPIIEPNADRFVAELAKVSPGTRPIVLAPGEETEV